MKLTRQQEKQLHAALVDAYDPSSLERLTHYDLEVALHNIVDTRQAFLHVVFELIAWVNREDRVADLVRSAHAAIPKNKLLRDIAVELGLAIDAPPRLRLERMLKEFSAEFRVPPDLSRDDVFSQMLQLFASELNLKSSMQQQTQTNRIFGKTNLHDIAALSSRLTDVARRVCLIEMDNSGMATGFLVGPNAVLTAYHGVGPALDGKTPPNTLRLRFDYHRDATDSSITRQGEEYRLADDWLIAHAPFSSADLGTGGGLPEPEQLNFALLQVEGIADSNRGWVDITHSAELPEPDTPLYIAQHIYAHPLQMSLQRNAIIKANSNQTRLFYMSETGPGSSGAPCFDDEWRCIAVHSGRSSSIRQETHQVGVPITKIANYLVANGLGQWINA